MDSQPDRVFLRALALPDVPIYASWGLDRRFCEHAGWTVDLPLAAHEAHWRKLISQSKVLRLAAVAGAELVGYADLAGDAADRRELGYVIGPSSRWGQGLGGTVARLALDHGFHHLGLHEIWAEALDANRASVSILTSLGMTETGRGDDESFLGRPSFYRRFSITSRS